MLRWKQSPGSGGPVFAGSPPGGTQWSGVDSYNAAQGQVGAAKYDNKSRTTESNNQRRTGMAGAYGGLGAAGMNAVGQYGSNVAGALANSNIAAGNTFGSMANSYYNTMGQMGQIGGALSAAGLTASSNAANARMLGNASMGGNFNMGGGGGGGYGGFGVSGPGGDVASGSMGGGPGVFGAGMNTGSSWNTEVQRGGGAGERSGMLNQGFDFLGGAMKTLNDPRNPAGALAGLADNQFNQNRAAMMDPRFLNTMTGMFRDSQSGIDAQSGMFRRDSALGRQSRSGQPMYRSSMDANPFYNYAQSRGRSNSRKFGI